MPLGWQVRRTTIFKFTFIPLFFLCNCSYFFSLDVKKEAQGPDFLLSEIECERSGYRIPVIEELIWSDFFGGMHSMHEGAKNYMTKIVLSSSREGILDFHLGYDLDTHETFIFRDTIPVGIGFCIEKKKTWLYYMAEWNNQLISWLNGYFRDTKYLYLGEGTANEAELLCLKFSQVQRRTILPKDQFADFKSSNTFYYLRKFGNTSYWVSTKNAKITYVDAEKVGDAAQVNTDIDHQKKSIVCVF